MKTISRSRHRGFLSVWFSGKSDTAECLARQENKTVATVSGYVVASGVTVGVYVGRWFFAVEIAEGPKTVSCYCRDFDASAFPGQAIQ